MLASPQIQLDPSVKHITPVACMVLSGIIENGICLTSNPYPHITIYKDRVDFGKCYNPELDAVSGLIIPFFCKEYGDIIYRYHNNFKLSFWNKTLDYIGVLPPQEPDNSTIFELLYPQFA